MDVLDRLPALPQWVPYPIVVGFVIEGILIGLIGFLIRDYLGHYFQDVVIFGNILFFVGSATALVGGLAWIVLVALNR